MRARAYALAGAATLLLTAGSVAALAATGGLAGPDVHGMDRSAADSCVPPTSLPGQRVTVTLGDMAGRGSMMGGNGNGGMMARAPVGSMVLRALPTSVSAGQISFLAVNNGTRTHELVVLPLADGRSAGSRSVGSDDTIAETGSLGEASNNCGPGAGEGIRAGSSSWVTLTLEAGRYELVCNLPGHYAAGMYAELDVG